MKKIVCIVLCLALIVCIGTVSAFAQAEDSRAVTCTCGGTYAATTYTSNYPTSLKCAIAPGTYYHHIITKYKEVRCDDCGDLYSGPTIIDQYQLCSYTRAKADHGTK